MFKWHHEYSVEVDVSLNVVLNFLEDFNNWPRWVDQFDSFHVKKIEGNTTTYLAKVKNKNAHLPILVTEIEPSKEYQMLCRVPFFTQTSTRHYQIISPEKTKITVNTIVTSFLTPFFKSFYLKKSETQYSKMLKALLDFISNH